MVLVQVVIDAEATAQYFRFPMAPGRYRVRVLSVDSITDKAAHADMIILSLSSSQMNVYQLRATAQTTTALQFPIENVHVSNRSGVPLEFDMTIAGAQMDWTATFSAVLGAAFSRVVLNLDMEPFVL